MKSFVISCLAASAVAFPQLHARSNLDARASNYPPRGEIPGCRTSKLCNTVEKIPDSMIRYDPNNLTPAQKASKARPNSGALYGGLKFDAQKQYVSQSGEHAYAPPNPDEIRGPCPGLNVAANHGYLPRSGVANIQQTIDGLGEMIGMSIDLAGFLAAYAVLLDGDFITLTWSIGGPQQTTSLLSGLLSQPKGMSFAHNNYEGDSSIGRCDSYINDGDAHSLSIERFKAVYELGLEQGVGRQDEGGLHTHDSMARAYAKNAYRSERQNPLYFAPLFSTTLVAPAAYNFVVAFLSNYSAEEPTGYLTGESFKSWFAVDGDYPNFTWLPGQERMPPNWYRRPHNPLADYDVVRGVFGNLINSFLAYPNMIRFGGNINGVNTYRGIAIDHFTSGQHNESSFTDTQAFGCLIYQNIQQVLPNQLEGLVHDVTAALKLVTKYITPLNDLLGCPAAERFDHDALNAYPGHHYSPTGPSNIC